MDLRAAAVILLLIPTAGAYELAFEPEGMGVYEVAPDLSAVPARPGDPVSARLTLLHDGAPVANARLTLASGDTMTTNGNGVALFSFFEDGGSPHLQTEEVVDVAVLRNGTFVSVQGEWPDLSVLWTGIYVRIVAPAEVVAGEPADVLVEAYWTRTGQLAPGVRVTLDVDGDVRSAVAEDGTHAFEVTAADPGSLPLIASVAAADRPNGVVPRDPARLNLTVQAEASDDGTSGDPDDSGDDGSGSGGSNGSGSGGSGSGSGSTGDGTDDASDDPDVVTSGPAPTPEPVDTLHEPLAEDDGTPEVEDTDEDSAPSGNDSPALPLTFLLVGLLALTRIRRP